MLRAFPFTGEVVHNVHTKCGEIHYEESHWNFLCIFCTDFNARTHDEFRSHFESQHFSILMDMLKTNNATNPTDIPFLEEETIVTESLNSVNAKLDDPLHLRKEYTSNAKAAGENNGQEEILHDVSKDTVIDNALKAKDSEHFIAGDMSYSMEKNEISGDDFATYIDNSIEMENLSENDSNNGDSKIDWNTSFPPDHLKHSKKRPYKPRNKVFCCTYCGRTFRRRYQFDTHLNIHTGAKPHQCDICGRQFRAVTTLQRHLSTHKQRSFVCNYCDKTFTHKVALLSHETRHTQERNEPCDLCEKRFYTVNQLDTHKRRVHKKSNDVLPFACDLCPNRYRTASMLSTHKCRKHYKTAKFQCEKCDKKFIDQQRLEEHRSKTHIDSKVSTHYVSIIKNKS